MSAPLFDLQHLGVRLGANWALRGLNLRVNAGERLALVGSNGSGKSTLLRVFNGLLAPREGTAVVPARRDQALLFQRPHMLRTSAWRNVALGLWLGGVRWHEARERAHGALVRVGLGERAADNARHFSGGQQQRLALARAWARRPRVLLLDEPTASLDPHAKRDVEALVADFATDGLTLVFASHNLGQVKRLATRVVYLENGQLLADLPVRDFFDDPTLRRASPAAAAFVRGELG